MSSGEEDLNPPRMKHWPPTFRPGGRQLPEGMHFNCGPYIIGGCSDSYLWWRARQQLQINICSVWMLTFNADIRDVSVTWELHCSKLNKITMSASCPCSDWSLCFYAAPREHLSLRLWPCLRSTRRINVVLLLEEFWFIRPIYSSGPTDSSSFMFGLNMLVCLCLF